MRRIFEPLIMPLGIVFLLGVAALLILVLCRGRKSPLLKRLPPILGLAAVLILYVASIRPTGVALIGWLERPFPLIAATALQSTDAIMVFGGDTEIARDADGSLELDPGSRFEAAIRLMEADRAPMLIFSGAGSKVPGDSLSEGEHLRAKAIARGISPDRIVLTRLVINTADEANALREMAQSHGWKRITLVTNAFHMGRAVRLVEAQGLEAIAFPSSHSLPLPRQPLILDYIPRIDGLTYTTRAMHEILGRIIP